MPRLYRFNKQEYLTRVRIALQIALSDPEIAAAIALFGFDALRVAAGIALLETAETLFETQKAEYDQQYTATEELNQARAAADARYTLHRKIALVLFEDDPERQRELDINQRKQLSLSGWLGQVQRLYTHALANQEIMDAFAYYNVTPADLEAGQALVQEVLVRKEAQEREKGQAQQATRDRDAALEVLADWMDKFAKIAAIALSDRPQLLESLQLGAIR